MRQPPNRSPRPSQTGANARASAAGGRKSVAPTSDVERALALRDVMEHVVKVEKEVARARPVVSSVRARSVIAVLVCVPLLAFCIYSYTMRPAFIWGEAERPVEPARQEANVRFAMFLLAQRIHQYRDEFGALPQSLIELGDSVSGVVYAPLSDSVFALTGSENGKAIEFRSDASADAFLGNSVALVAGRRGAGGDGQ